MAKVWQTVFRSLSSSIEFINTVSVNVEIIGPDVTEASPAAVASAVDDWLRTPYLGMLHPGYTLEDITVNELTTGADETSQVTVGVGGTLPSSTGHLPLEVCGILSLRTALATRSTRGRIFVPSPGESGQLAENDAWSTAADTYYDAMKTFGDALLAGHDFTEGVIDYHASTVIWSRKNSSKQDVTGYLARTRPHWLRSRSTAP